MTFTPFPDAEYLAVSWLSTRLGGVKVSTDLRGWTSGQARVVITRTGGVPRLWLRTDYPRLDVDSYHANKAAAHDLAQKARAVLFDMPTGEFDAAVVSAVEDDTGLAWIPDADTNAPRYVFGVRLVTHTLP